MILSNVKQSAVIERVGNTVADYIRIKKLASDHLQARTHNISEDSLFSYSTCI